jgi:hypothetical protein
MAQPIKPYEVGSKKADLLPDVVIESLNYLIDTHFVNKRAFIYADHARDFVKAKCKEHNIHFEDYFMDIEEAYRAAGWKVKYGGPAYNETYRASYEFSK